MIRVAAFQNLFHLLPTAIRRMPVVIMVLATFLLGDGALAQDVDTATERVSENGLYSVSFVPRKGEAALGPISVWLLRVSDDEGNPVSGAAIAVDGGMPDHGHGLVTAPAAIGEVEPGLYEIDGMKFSMAGWWRYEITIAAEAGRDTVVFNVVLD